MPSQSRAGFTRCPLIRSRTHVPDQPIERLRVLHWTVDLAARASAILATAPLTFMRFRELTPARGNALFQLFCPVEYHLKLLAPVFLPVRRNIRKHHDEILAVGTDVVDARSGPDDASDRQRSGPSERKCRHRLNIDRNDLCPAADVHQVEESFPVRRPERFPCTSGSNLVLRPSEWKGLYKYIGSP